MRDTDFAPFVAMLRDAGQTDQPGGCRGSIALPFEGRTQHWASLPSERVARARRAAE